MTRFPRTKVPQVVLATAIAATICLTACNAKKVGGADTTSTAGSSAGRAAPARFYSQLPAAVRNAGVLHLGTDATEAPFATVASDNKTIVGVNQDLAQAMAPLLGVRMDLQNVNFDQSVPSVKDHRLDLYWDWSKDRPVSEQQVDFIDFATTGAGMLVPQGNPDNITSPADLCGKAVAVESGSSNIQIMQGVSSTQCTSQNKPAIQLLQFDTLAADLLQLKSGRAKAVVTAYGACAYLGKTSPLYDLAGTVISPVKAGWTIAKDNTDLRDVIAKALQALINDGTYAKVMAKWGLAGSEITTVTINDKPLTS